MLIHQYDKVLIDIVWESTQNDLQPLKDAAQALLDSLPADDGTRDDE